MLFVVALASPLAHSQTILKLSSSEALVQDLDTAKSLGGMGRLLIEKDGRTKKWADYCGESVGFSNRGLFRDAVQQAARALSIGEQTNDPEALFFASRDLSYAYYLAGDTAKALEWMERTDVAFKSAGFRDPMQAATPMMIRGKLMLATGKYQEALDASTRSLNAFPFFGYRERVDAAKLDVAEAQIGLGNEAAALKTIEEIAKSGDSFNKSRAQAEWAKLLLRSGKVAEANEKASQAVATSVKEGPLVQAGILKIRAQAQLQAVDKAGALTSLESAIDFVSKSRGKFSSAAVRSGLLTSNQSLFDDAIDLAMESGQHEKAIIWSEASKSQLMLDQLRERQTVKLPNIQNLDELVQQSGQTQFLGFHVGSKKSHAWLIEGGKVRAHTINIGKSELAKTVEMFRNQIIAGGSTPHTTAQTLYVTLLAPLQIAESVPIVVVPSGPLHMLPFQALRTGKGWLAQQTPIRYEMSLAAAVNVDQAPRRDSLFAVGNPTLSKSEYSLPGSEAEVNAIKRYFPESTLALRTDATRAKFLSESVKAGFVHAAAHVTMDELDPMQSALKLSGFGKESGDVVAGDFLKLDLNQVNLVTLSACNSGIGRIAPGDEFYGFKRSILLSGAKSLALTYWAVDDESTAELMTQFYKHLREGKMSAHMALQKAQSEMMANAKFSEPYHWASFMLVGTF